MSQSESESQALHAKVSLVVVFPQLSMAVFHCRNTVLTIMHKTDFCPQGQNYGHIVRHRHY